MAVKRTARLKRAEMTTADESSRWMAFELPEGELLGFEGGQYIIIDSGTVMPNGKIAKRAYSIVSSDLNQTSFELVVKKVPAAQCSGFMHQVEMGAEVSFSGPWGKWGKGSEAEAESESNLLIATDTGITAALGLLNARHFASRLSRTQLVWLTSVHDGFLPLGWVGERVPADCKAFQSLDCLPIGHPERAEQAMGLIASNIHSTTMPHSRSAYLVGDGAVLCPLRERWIAAGLSTEKIALECFFNNPLRKASL